MGKNLREENLQLKTMLSLYEEVLHHINQGVYITDAEETIIWANNLILRTEQATLEELAGKKEYDVWPDMYPASNNRYKHQAGKEFLLSFFTMQGEKHDILTRSYPFAEQDKTKFIYSIGSNTDYSDRQIAKILEYRHRHLNKKGKAANETVFTLQNFIGQSKNVLAMLSIAQKVALKNSPVMICGQTGTGKEIIAQGIHNASLQREGKFVGVNCAAIPENLLETEVFGSVKGAFTGAVDKNGLLEEAAGGTLFLDEINSMPLSVQGKLLRVLQERRFNRIGSNKPIDVTCRFISATNQNPGILVEENTLRQDLYFRLSVVSLTVPPLNTRKEDIPLLVEVFLRHFSDEYHMKIKNIDAKCADVFQRYAWPGNVRELEHVIEYMMNVTTEKETLSANDLPPYLLSSFQEEKEDYEQYLKNESTLSQIMDQFEHGVLVEALKKNNNNISRTAKALGIRRETLHYHLKKLGIQVRC